MNKKEITHNIGLTFDFVRELIRNPALVEKLPDYFELEFVEKDKAVKSLENLEHTLFVRVKNAFELIEKEEL